jgi:transcriptional regulator with XRE-family HTH domain
VRCEIGKRGEIIKANQVQTVPQEAERKMLGDRIQKARILLGYSQQGFANKCGLNSSHLGEVERGECDVTFAVLCAICDGLSCDVAAVTKGIPSRPT